MALVLAARADVDCDGLSVALHHSAKPHYASRRQRNARAEGVYDAPRSEETAARDGVHFCVGSEGDGQSKHNRNDVDEWSRQKFDIFNSECVRGERVAGVRRP